MKQTLPIILLIIFLGACDSGSSRMESGIEIISVPATNTSHLPFLHTSSAGETHLSWVEELGDTAYFKYSKLTSTGWSEPKEIARGTNWFVNWADFPSLVAHGKYMTAHWLQKRAAGTYDYDIYITQSDDGGETWQTPFILHQDGIAAEHGFVSLVPSDSGKVFATWLDGRNTKASGHHNHDMATNGAMTLRAAWLNADGKTTSEWELDNRTCDCCQTDALITKDGPVIVYRDRSPNEIRDIYITRLFENEWSKPKPVHEDFWEIPGCPVNGPTIAAEDSLMAIAWFTAVNETAKVQWAVSSDDGESFSVPTVLAEGNTNGRVDMIALGKGHFGVSWMEIQGDQAVIQWARINAQGDVVQKIKVAETSRARASGFPVMTRGSKGVIMAWTTLEKGNPEVQSAWINY